MDVLHSPSEGDRSQMRRPKLAIPRLKRPEEYDTHPHGASEKRRVAQACEPCRKKKTKCDGDRPSCYLCGIAGADCYYEDGKRERERKTLKALETRITMLEGLIHDIEPFLDSKGLIILSSSPFSHAQAFTHAQSPYSNYTPSPRRISVSTNEENRYDTLPTRNPEIRAGESVVSADAGPTNDLNHVTEVGKTASVISPSGYLGETGEVAWMDRVFEESEKSGHNACASVVEPLSSQEVTDTTPEVHELMGSTQPRTQGTLLAHSTLDDLDFSILGRQVDMFSLPPKEVADRLVGSYFDIVHPLFPIICKPLFMTQYEAYYALPNGEGWKKWLTVLNLVFAIGETCLKSELGITQGDEKKDVEYFVKSRVLGALDGGSVFEIPNLARIQALGLTGMYLLATIQTNRAWNVVGLAIRLAHGIGLHLRNDNLLDGIRKNMRLRIWYCLCCLETSLCLITGRPCSIQDRYCSAPCPTALDDEILPGGHDDDSVLDDYFLKHRNLMFVSTEVLNILYSAQTPKDKSWPQIQDSVRDLSVVLELWRVSLPFPLDFLNNHQDRILKRQRLNLEFQYHNILMLITRPCLCLMDGRIPNESSESREFNKLFAATCIRSARAIIHLVVKEPDPNNLPWWCLLHYLMPAKAIIMLELVRKVIDTPKHKAALFAEGKMILDWLNKVSKVNMSLRRYSVEFADQLKKVAPKIEDYFEEEDEPNNNFTMPSFVDLPHFPFQSSTDGGIPPSPEKFLDNQRGQYFGTVGPEPAWWPSTQGENDQIMADVEQVDLYAYSSYPQR